MKYTLGIEESLRNIFGAILVGGLRKDNPQSDEIIRTSRVCVSRFLATFPSNVFNDEYAIYYSIINDLNTKFFTINQLDEIIENNRDLVLDSPYVDLSNFQIIGDGRQSTDDEKIEAFKANLRDLLIELSNEYIMEEEYKSSCTVYISWFKNQYMKETAQNMTMIMSDIGFDERKPGKRTKHYQGLDDCQTYYNERNKVLRELSEEHRIKSYVLDNKWFEEEMAREDMADDNTLFTFGIKEIDEVVGELRRSNMLGVLGPPKGGKTRMSNYIVQRALSLGLNVAVWPLEGTDEEWIANQCASYIKRVSKVSFNSKTILQRKYRDNPKIRKYVASAKLAIATSGEMGRLSFITGVASVEGFLDVLDDHYKNVNPFDIIVIDSLVNVTSDKGKGKVERISEAYMMLKNYIANVMPRPALAVVPAQLKQDVVDYIRKNPDETLDVTSGGESAETIRTPDEVIGLFSTKEERGSGIMKIYSVASRHSGNFDDFMVKCDLQCCDFWSEPTLNE